MFLALLLLGCPSAPRVADRGADTAAGDTGGTPDSGGDDTSADTDSAPPEETDTGDTGEPVITCTPVVDSITELGELPLGHLSGVEGGWSQPVGGASYWVFREVVAGTAVRGGLAAVSDDASAADGLEALLVGTDADGVPVELLPDDPADDCEPEPYWGAVRAGPYSALAWVANGDEALLFFAKTCLEEGARGTGIARWTPRASVNPQRLRAGSGADPEVMFPVDPTTELGVPANFLPARAALVVDVGGAPYVYTYSCNTTFWSVQSCGVGRAAWDEAEDPAAWAVWNGDAWTPELGAMEFLFQTTFDGGLSVSWNEAIGAYVAWLPLGEYGVGFATAPEPQGPWSTPVVVADPDGNVGDVMAHPELGHPGVEYVGVGSDAGFALWEVRYVCEG